MNTRPSIKTHLDAVLYSFCKMDVDMVSTLLENKYTYQDYSKTLFIRKLGDLFFEFSQLGDVSLHREKGECVGCSCGINGYTFIGNKSQFYIDIVFVTNENDKIIDIYECGEFFTKKTGVSKKNRLYIDKYEEYDIEGEDFWGGNDSMNDDDDLPF